MVQPSEGIALLARISPLHGVFTRAFEPRALALGDAWGGLGAMLLAALAWSAGRRSSGQPAQPGEEEAQ